jgi:cell division septum initiation protein DivIVA
MIRPGAKRGDPNELEVARKVVGRAERDALERAEALRAEAEALLKSTSTRTVDAEGKVREEFEAKLRSLQEELDRTSRRATVAENALELLRTEHAELSARARQAGLEVPRVDTPGGDLTVAPLQMVSLEGDGDAGPSVLSEFVERMSDDTDRLMAAASAAASRMHSQAELDLARAKDEAVELLSAATQEAEDLLATAVAAIERDTAIAAATREQAQRDGDAANALREQLQTSVAKMEEDAQRIRDSARADAARIIDDAQREASEVTAEVRRRLAEEVTTLREAMDRTRDSFEKFLDLEVREGAAAGSGPGRPWDWEEQPGSSPSGPSAGPGHPAGSGHSSASGPSAAPGHPAASDD